MAELELQLCPFLTLALDGYEWLVNLAETTFCSKIRNRPFREEKNP